VYAGSIPTLASSPDRHRCPRGPTLHPFADPARVGHTRVLAPGIQQHDHHIASPGQPGA
jgi:hypothetical protein